MIETLKNGGPLIIPIILCGVIALFIIVERLHYFITVKKRDSLLMKTLLHNIERHDYSAAELDCTLASTPCAEVVKMVIDNRNLDEKDLKEAVQTKMDSVVQKFEHFLSALGTISSISTLLGLLGTVTGNIKAFGVIGGGASMGDPAALAGAIAEALVTTVAGLSVSIPAIIFHNYFDRQVNHRICDMESNVTQVIFRVLGKDI